MTVKITGVPFDQITPKIQEALDDSLAATLNLQQGSLGKANPKDTGRMASSWFVGQNNPPRETRPEGWAEPGAQRLDIKEYDQKITFKGTWFISNAVPYAEYVCYKYNPTVTKAQKDWFTSIANRTGQVFTRQFNKLKP